MPYDARRVMAHSYKHIDSVLTVGFEFGPQRAFSGTAPTAPSTGVKIRKGHPTQKQLIAASASGVGIEATDLVITVWAVTLSSTFAWDPKIGDIFEVSETERWIIKHVVSAMFGSQFVCLCQSSPVNTR